ncbi:hypothetical protein CARUB_v10024430mg [Capsella rubella]|uniref:Uncharacterized protein n=1 Tax=Capsella rubella TaxID=81985 RepID=R0FYU5_9BRAS|nr:hypothetical protein CARUB_v10024430mg [Capsella rubella]
MTLFINTINHFFFFFFFLKNQKTFFSNYFIFDSIGETKTVLTETEYYQVKNGDSGMESCQGPMGCRHVGATRWLGYGYRTLLL